VCRAAASDRLPAALDLILTGRALDARRAEKAGLIARAVPAAWLIERAHERVTCWQTRRSPPPRRLPAARAGRGWFRRHAARRGDRAAAGARRAGTGGHYPAPIAAIDVIAHAIGRPVEEGSRSRPRTSRPGGRAGVQEPGADLRAVGAREEGAGGRPRRSSRAPIARWLLIGAGIMGGGIAELASRNGVRVRLRDLKPEALTHALRSRAI
jgi:3-hydroxyacyl-CoA dehydrogenase/enoyl-CoA hydratase/3-hydroxybutyryl-CoA epimerase